MIDDFKTIETDQCILLTTVRIANGPIVVET